MNFFIKPLLITALFAAVLVGCESPLDTDTPRIETPLTPAPKVTPRTIEPFFETSQGSYSFDGLPNIRVDTTVSPMRFWMDFELDETTDSPATIIQGFRIIADSMAANGLSEQLSMGQGYMWIDPVGNGPERVDFDNNINTAVMLISEYERVPGKPREVDITIYLVGNKGDLGWPGLGEGVVLGKIHLVI